MTTRSYIILWLILWPVTSLMATSNQPYNVAIGKPSWQSSTYQSYGAHYANDGDLSMSLHQGCAHLPDTPDEWWKVDLCRKYEIVYVKITTRNSNPLRLSHFEIRVGMKNETPTFNQSQNALCHYQEQYQPLGTTQYDCPSPIRGRYVTIAKSSAALDAWMTLCEVQVFAKDWKPRARRYHFADGTVDGSTKWVVAARSSIECIKNCMMEDNCYGANWNQATKTCEIVIAPGQLMDRMNGVNSYMWSDL